jgi:[DsrC]-trisulfide reductase subunit P
VELSFKAIEGKSRGYKILIGVLSAGVLLLLVSFLVAYLSGHQVWGANNRIPWGQPVILLIYFIGLSAGAIVVSALGYVLKREAFKPIGRIAVYLGLLLMIGAMISVLADLGRVEKFWRLFMFFYLNNMTSMFAINGVLYGGYIVLMLVYLWAVMEGRSRLAVIIGIIDVLWAIAVHTGTGSIFAFMANRELMYSSLRPFEFIVAALSSGTAALILVVTASYRFTRRKIDPKMITALGKLLLVFMLTLALMIFFDKMVHNYFPHRGPTEFLFTGQYWPVFWIFQIGFGILIPTLIIANPKTGNTLKWVVIASCFVVIGVLGERIALVVPGTALVQPIFHGTVEGIWGTPSTFLVTPWETCLSIGIFCTVGLLYVLGLRYMDLMPDAPSMDEPPEITEGEAAATSADGDAGETVQTEGEAAAGEAAGTT